MGMRGFVGRVVFSLWCMASVANSFAADEQTGLPVGSDLNDDATTNPREVFHSEASRGRRSYLSNLGNLAFNSPYTLGETAQKAHMSCGTCHVNGASNPRLFIPGLSSRPGTFDTTSSLFNPKTDNGVLDPVTIPSLRGARFQAPYGHDGRTGSLRDFVHNVIVNEFAGREPSPQILDAIVAYVDDIDFLPNPNLDATGQLEPTADSAARRGQALFSRPFPHDRSLSCAGCHVPSAAFVDHREHDIGSGGLFKTPTLLNADFNGPYFHDGRFDNYSQVIDHFNRVFDLGLASRDRADLAAYLAAIGNGARPQYQLTGVNVLEDENGFASVLDIAIAQHDTEVVSLATRTVSDQLRDLADHYPDPQSAGTASGVDERRLGGTAVGVAAAGEAASYGANELRLARATIGRLVETLQQVNASVTSGDFAAAAGDYLSYRKLTAAAAPRALQTAEPWSLFNPTLHVARQAVFQQPAGARPSTE
jgi:Di-haem cytochrome c peroxidase